MIFVLGGQGFVGSAFVRWAQAQAKPVAVIGKDNYVDYVGKSCDLLINANGNARKYLSDHDPREDFNLSVKSVLESLFDFRFTRYVYISSVAVYNNTSDPSRNHEGVQIHPEGLSNYGYHKYLSELLVKKYGSDWLVIRLGGVVGERMWKSPIYDMLSGNRLHVGHHSKFQFINTDVVARCVFQLVALNRVREVFNICGRGTITLSSVQQLIGRSQPNNLNVEEWNISTDKAHRLLDLPTTEQTIVSFINQWRKDQSMARQA